MLEFKRGDTEVVHKCPENWGEITLGRYIKFHKLYQTLTKEIEDKAVGKEINILQVIRKHPAYFKKIVGFWLGITGDEIDLFVFTDVLSVWGAISKVLEQPTPNNGSKQFTFRGQSFHIAKDKINHYGQRMPLSGQTFGEVVEFLQVEETQQAVDKGDFGAIPIQIAILYRAEGDKDTSELVTERAELFNELTMDIVWDIAFFLTNRKRNFLNDFQASSNALGQLQEQHALQSMAGTIV